MTGMYQPEIVSLITTFTGQQRTLVIPRTFVDFFQSIEVALFFSQCIYWSDRATLEDRWFYKSYAEWKAELGLSEYQVRKSSRALAPYLETKVRKVGGNPTLHYRIIWPEFSVSFLEFLQEPTQRNSRNHSEETPGTLPITEITTETTDIEKQQPLDPSQIPDWYTDLWSIKGFKTSLTHCQDWMKKNAITLAKANATAAAVKGRWDSKKYKDPWAVFRAWVQRPDFQNAGNPASSARPTRPPGDRTAAELKAQQERLGEGTNA